MCPECTIKARAKKGLQGGLGSGRGMELGGDVWHASRDHGTNNPNSRSGTGRMTNLRGEIVSTRFKPGETGNGTIGVGKTCRGGGGKGGR